MALATIDVQEVGERAPVTSPPIDLSGLVGIRETIMDCVDWLQNPDTMDALRPDISRTLVEEVASFGEIMKDSEGTFRFQFLSKTALRGESLKRLFDAYSTTGMNGNGHGPELFFPSTELTEVKALPYELGRSYNPVVNALIKTPLDPPLTIFDRSRGGVVEQQGIGRWYQFPLRDVAIQIFR